MLLAIQYPQRIHPEIIPGFSLFRWYGAMYLFAFGTAYLLFRYQVRKGELQSVSKLSITMTPDDITDFFFAAILGLILGARIFSTLVYETEINYLRAPWLIFWPFDVNGNWTGLQGMSYHGGFIGGLLGMLIWARKKKFPIPALLDTIAAALPLGYTFGRLGNFINGELYGRITTSPIGMIFPQVPMSERFPASESWVVDFATQVGITIPDGAQLVNLPRHPSQLYEAFFEGVVLWLVLWFIRKKKPFNGFLAALYTIGYGMIRFIIEYFRQPDVGLGYRFGETESNVIYRFTSVFNLSTGQVLCLTMIIGGCMALFLLHHLQKKQSVAAHTE